MTVKNIAGSSCYITIEGKVLSKNLDERKPKLTKTGYHEISIYFGKGTGVKWFRVHRLVAQHFIPNPENKPFVNHIDGDKTNNRLENLEWVTHQENMEHAKNFGLVHRAEKNKRSVHTSQEVEDICKLLEMGYRNTDIAKSIGTTIANVTMIRTGHCWTHISCKYNIPNKSRSLSCETIHWICKQIEAGLTQGEIVALGYNPRITRTMIKDIRRKHIYVDISKHYDF